MFACVEVALSNIVCVCGNHRSLGAMSVLLYLVHPTIGWLVCQLHTCPSCLLGGHLLGALYLSQATSICYTLD